MPFFSQEFIQSVREANNIEDLIREYVSLTKRSGTNFFGLCPFHSEKTPSFCVSCEKQYFHCFGCKKSGDVISFVKEIEHLSYHEAIIFLAKRQNMPLPSTKLNKEGLAREEKTKRLYRLNALALEFFASALYSKEGKKALNYLESRRFKTRQIKDFKLGYAPASWDSLYNFIKNKLGLDFRPEDLVHLGLIKESRKQKNKYYDAFRDRLMFPILDAWQNVIAFGGRRLENEFASLKTDDNYLKPKYINSQESDIYHKGDNLYGLYLAKKSLFKNIIIVEGYIDAISMHTAGFDSCVALLGTALTAKQIKQLKRYNKSIILALDQDSSGKEASFKALVALQKAGFSVNVLAFNTYKDPDELLKTRGKKAMELAIHRALSPFKFAVHYFELKNRSQNGLDTKAVVANILSYLKSLDLSSIEREHNLQFLVQRYNLPYQALCEDYERSTELKEFNNEASFVANEPAKQIFNTSIPTHEPEKEAEKETEEIFESKTEEDFVTGIPKIKPYLHQNELMVMHLLLRSGASLSKENLKLDYRHFLSKASRHFAKYVLLLDTDKAKENGMKLGIIDELGNVDFFKQIYFAKFYNFYQGNLADLLLDLQLSSENFNFDMKSYELWQLRLLETCLSKKMEAVCKKLDANNPVDDRPKLEEEFRRLVSLQQKYRAAIVKITEL